LNDVWCFHGEYPQVITVRGYSEGFCLVKDRL
jgi:hypothetical protein